MTPAQQHSSAMSVLVKGILVLLLCYRTVRALDSTPSLTSSPAATTGGAPSSRAPLFNLITEAAPTTGVPPSYNTTASAPATGTPPFYNTTASAPATGTPPFYNTTASAPTTGAPLSYTTAAPAPATGGPPFYTTTAAGSTSSRYSTGGVFGSGTTTYYYSPTSFYVSTRAVGGNCPDSGTIECGTNSRCVSIGYICDGDNDCGDRSDEAEDLCEAWRSTSCSRNSVMCTRKGRSDCIPVKRYCKVFDPPCEPGNFDLRLCKMLSDDRLQPLSSIILETTTPASTTPPTTVLPVHYRSDELIDNFQDKLDSTLRHKECDELYTLIGEQCVSIFFMGSLNWFESRAFCQTIGGDLLTLKDDLSNFVTILNHVRNNHITKDFWIGGLNKNQTLGWRWLNDAEMKIGSPFWAVRYYDICTPRQLTSPILNITTEVNNGYCYHYRQAPDLNSGRDCAAINYANYYYISDENCMARKSPLCVLPVEHPKQAL